MNGNSEEKPLRVLHVLHSMNRGGTEMTIMNYYRHIDRAKVQFDFLLTESSRCQFEDEILGLGGRIFRIPSIGKFSLFFYLSSLRRFFREHPCYRIVHSHTSSKSSIPLWIAKIFGVPVRICHSHNTRSESGMKGLIRNLLKVPLRFVATDFLACGQEAADWLYGRKTPARKGAIIFPNVIEAPGFCFSPEKRAYIRKVLGIEDDCFVVGHVGRFSLQKNHVFVVDVFEELHKMHPNSKLLLVGDGELRSGIEQKIESRGLLPSVIFTGVVPNVADFLQAMDVFLFPSFYEGLGLVIIEAQISGLHCYATKGGVPEEGNVAGLVHYLDLNEGPRHWAKALLENADKKREGRLKDIVESGYDAERSAGRLQDFYMRRFRESCLESSKK